MERSLKLIKQHPVPFQCDHIDPYRPTTPEHLIAYRLRADLLSSAVRPNTTPGPHTPYTFPDWDVYANAVDMLNRYEQGVINDSFEFTTSKEGPILLDNEHPMPFLQRVWTSTSLSSLYKTNGERHCDSLTTPIIFAPYDLKPPMWDNAYSVGRATYLLDDFDNYGNGPGPTTHATVYHPYSPADPLAAVDAALFPGMEAARITIDDLPKRMATRVAYMSGQPAFNVDTLYIGHFTITLDGQPSFLIPELTGKRDIEDATVDIPFMLTPATWQVDTVLEKAFSAEYHRYVSSILMPVFQPSTHLHGQVKPYMGWQAFENLSEVMDALYVDELTVQASPIAQFDGSVQDAMNAIVRNELRPTFTTHPPTQAEAV